MALLFVLLLVAEVPTIYFNWPNTYDSLIDHYIASGLLPDVLAKNIGTAEVSAANSSSPAWCFFNVRDATRQYDDERLKLQFLDESERPPWQLYFPTVATLAHSTALQSAVISMLLLSFNFFTRIVKLSTSLTGLVNARIRPWCGDTSRRVIVAIHADLLRTITKHAKTPADLHVAKQRLLYIYTKPTLATLLLGRLYADYYGSMAFEVSIILFAFFLPNSGDLTSMKP